MAEDEEQSVVSRIIANGMQALILIIYTFHLSNAEAKK
jgi:tetrahydromethanopterin S-methyltransferase subunit C